METIVKEFASEREMGAWLADPANLDDLKSKYPPGEYSARLDMIDRKVIVTAKS